jgi:4-amino-4-deoxy-L-arabinose transferase-like glycosyltransferase
LGRHRHVPRWFWLPAILLVGLRFLHLGPELDDPHFWRQSDTANYIWDYYQNGVDLLHPSVCWMGAHKTVIFEFPLPEAIVAWLYQALGPDLIWGRLFFLLVYLGGAIYFFKIVRHLTQAELAAVATLIYLTLPLGIVYSRAIHIDFSAVFCAHAMLYYVLRAVDRESRGLFLVAMLFAALGFMIKAPYVFFLALPAAGYIHFHSKWRFFLRSTPLLAIPVLSFAAWQWHVVRVNSAMPDWSFIPEYHKMDNMGRWYFGLPEHRLEVPLWRLLWGRLKYEIAAIWGIPLLLIGLVMRVWDYGTNVMRLWAAGSFMYLLIFFTLNVIHDYYQIPFLAPVAFFMALPLFGLYQLAGSWSPVVGRLILILCWGVFAIHCIRLTEGKSLNQGEQEYFGTYYREDELALKTGRLIREHTPEDALVIATFGGLDCRCPNILYTARRNGWSIGKQNLSVALLEQLRAEGATHFALLQIDPMSEELEAYVSSWPMQRFILPGTHWPLRIYEF